jgi:hypothetical protein
MNVSPSVSAMKIIPTPIRSGKLTKKIFACGIALERNPIDRLTSTCTRKIGAAILNARGKNRAFSFSTAANML